jgi:hypothetical protein
MDVTHLLGKCITLICMRSVTRYVYKGSKINVFVICALPL